VAKRLLLTLTAVCASNAMAGIFTPDAYEKKYAASALDRAAYYAPVWGGTYRQKWEEIIKLDPNTRAIAIHLHGCGGLSGYESLVASFMSFRLGLAVITPDFTARPGNKTGCPGKFGDQADMLAGGGQRARQGLYSAVNSDRMDARTDDVELIVEYIKTLTDKPIIISGHSEGARTAYHYDKVDPRIVGIALHQQSCTPRYNHIFRLPTTYKTWQSLDSSDPWAMGANEGVWDCGAKFPDEHKVNFTLYRQSGTNHAPLNSTGMKISFGKWVNDLLGGEWKMIPFDNEAILPSVQKKYELKKPD
jgi:dienelactone hydrolase